MITKTYEYIDLGKILLNHNIFLRKGDISVKAFLDFTLKAAMINAKQTQVFLNVAYEKRTFFLEELRMLCPNIEINSADHTDRVDISTFFTAVNGVLFKKQAFFSAGTLKVLTPPTNTDKEVWPEALTQTKQPYPDYIYILDMKTSTWKYYDLKSTISFVNRGHILGVSNKEEYERIICRLMLDQRDLYKQYPEIQQYIIELQKDETLSWSERNTSLQQFYFENAQKYPDINPSMVFQNELLYEIQKQKVPASLQGIITQDALINKINTQKLIQKSLDVAGPEAKMTYMKTFGNNPNIMKALQQSAAEGIKFLLNQ